MDLTPQYSAANILKAYDEQMQHDRDVDKYRRWIYAAKSLADPSYARSATGARIRAKFGTSSKGTTGMISRMKMLRDEEQDWIKGQFDERQFKEMRTWESIDDFYKFAGEQGPYYDKERGLGMALKHINARDKEAQRALEKATKEEGEDIKRWVSGYAGSFRKRPAEIRGAVADNDSIPDHLKEAVVKGAVDAIKNIEQTTAGMATAERQAKSDVEADMLGAFTTLITDRYSGRWRGQSTATQQGLLADIQAEIRSIKLDDFPLELRPALFKAVKDNLAQYGAMGAAYKEKKAEERAAVTQKREDIEFDQSQLDRAQRVGGIAIAQGMADDVRTLVDGGMDREEAVRKVTDANIRTNFDEEEFKRLAELITTEVSPTQAKKIQLENERDLTPTDNLQVNLNNFNRVLDREMLRGPQADPFWYDHDVWMRRRIAIDNALAVFERVAPGVIDQEAINEGWNKLLEREEIVAHLDTLDDAAANEFLKRLLVHGYYTFKGGNALGVPLIVMQRIVYPEKFTPGKKKK